VFGLTSPLLFPPSGTRSGFGSPISGSSHSRYVLGFTFGGRWFYIYHLSAFVAIYKDLLHR
jgi:hypothetical protein